ncbi:SusC/RagA family TonB-linked outer membrane protein [Flammeovirgaceae bacterium SG7u.111]|nr:SusC/RagA family TonB-linked outer membrane protein [Flammeovirgaceae bacterium SG7u.132]WPO35133.1 SusC/RagA family TonB-linked outer membrane protein [Flammeovirgaceae bacterium SG7u.111]
MKRKLLLCLSLHLFLSAYVFAQERVLTGKITSSTDGSPLPGVNVLIKGTTIGSISNFDGNFALKIPGDATTLVFSYIGFQSLEMEIGEKSKFDIVMTEDAKQLSEVVVTALGFEEDADGSGVAFSKIGGEELVNSGESTLINSMAGRASGVQISKSSGDPGAGAYIQIRGQSTITGASQPLVVIDGIPMSNTTGAPNADSGNSGENTGGVRQQSRMNDLNPADIESMQILKGAAAAALWGSRAANGVIVITTKKGKAGNKLNISFRTNLSFDQVNVLHPLQNTFGQGQGGIYNPTSSRSFGDKISLRSGGADDQITDPTADGYTGYFEGRDGTRYYAIPAGTAENPSGGKNSTETFNSERENDVFKTGTIVDTYLSMSGGNENSNFFLSFGDLNQDGIYKGVSDYRRSTVRLGLTRKFNKIFKVSGNASYARTTSNRVQTGSNVNGLYLGMLRAATDFDGSDYIGSYYASPEAAPIENSHRSYRRYLGNNPNPIYNNPLWTINELENSTIVNRFIMSSEMSLKPTKWFEVITRGGVDTYDDVRKTLFPVFSAGSNSAGRYREELFKETQLNFDAIGRFTANISPKINSTFLIGWNINDRTYTRLGGEMQNFLIPGGPNDFSNAVGADRFPTDTETLIRATRTYGSANFGFYDQLFVNVTGALESSSSFGAENLTHFYPSADVAWQFTGLSLFDNMTFLSFGKLRGGIGQVGVQPDPHRTSTDYVAGSFGSWGATLTGVGYGNGAFVQSSQQGDPGLKPEIKTEWEAGIDMRFFGDRLKTGFTYYENEIKDLLLEVAVAPSVGFTERYTNAGIMTNKGWELDLGYTLINSQDWNVELFANANSNKNEVTSLGASEGDVITLGGFSTLTSSVAAVGYPLSALFGGKYLRDEDGSLALNEDGFPQVAPDFGVIGDPNPDWRGGFGFNVSYKKVRLGVLFETFQGADFAPNTKSVLYNFGKHADTGNEVVVPSGGLMNYNGDLIPEGTVARGNIEDFGAGPVILDESWYTTLGQGFSNLQEQFIVDGSWTRLREVSLGYSISSPTFREKTKLSSIDISFTGRNLLLWTDVVGIDPETSLDGATNARGQDYFNNPGVKTYTFSLKIDY